MFSFFQLDPPNKLSLDLDECKQHLYNQAIQATCVPCISVPHQTDCVDSLTCWCQALSSDVAVLRKELHPSDTSTRD